MLEQLENEFIEVVVNSFLHKPTDKVLETLTQSHPQEMRKISNYNYKLFCYDDEYDVTSITCDTTFDIIPKGVIKLYTERRSEKDPLFKEFKKELINFFSKCFTDLDKEAIKMFRGLISESNIRIKLAEFNSFLQQIQQKEKETNLQKFSSLSSEDYWICQVDDDERCEKNQDGFNASQSKENMKQSIQKLGLLFSSINNRMKANEDHKNYLNSKLTEINNFEQELTQKEIELQAITNKNALEENFTRKLKEINEDFSKIKQSIGKYLMDFPINSEHESFTNEMNNIINEQRQNQHPIISNGNNNTKNDFTEKERNIRNILNNFKIEYENLVQIKNNLKTKVNDTDDKLQQLQLKVHRKKDYLLSLYDEPIAINPFSFHYNNDGPTRKLLDDDDDDDDQENNPIANIPDDLLADEIQLYDAKNSEWFDFYGPGGVITSDKRQVDWEHEEIFEKVWQQTLATLEKRGIRKPKTHLFLFLQQEKIRIQSGYLNTEQFQNLSKFLPKK